MYLTLKLGCLSYTLFRAVEERLFESQFLSSSKDITANFESNIARTGSSAFQLGQIYSYQFANSTQWPQVTLNGFEAISASFLGRLNLRGISFLPLVIPNVTQASFESYAYSQVLNNKVDSSSLILKRTNFNFTSGCYVKDGTKNVKDLGISNGVNFANMSFPVWQIAPIAANAAAVMYNIHSEPVRRKAIDYTVATNAIAITDVIQLVQDASFRPAALLFSPVLDVNDGDLLGLVSVVINWDSFLVNILPDYIVGLDVVMRTETKTITYHLSGSTVRFEQSDTHDSTFNYIGQQYELTTNYSGPNSYTLSIYPTAALQSSYYTDTPRNAMIYVVAISCLSIIIFLIYLYAVVDREVAEERNRAMIRSKAEMDFTTFLAHEVRNPLSGIDSSSELILGNLKDLLGDMKEVLRNEDMPRDEIVAEIKRWHLSLIQPIRDEKHITKCVSYIVSILSNSLDISKLLDRQLVLEVEKTYIRRNVINTAIEMTLADKPKDVTVSVDCEECVWVMCDCLRLTQVFINLLKNSYRYTKKGTVMITAKYSYLTGKMHVFVEDSGVTIAREFHTSFFDRYDIHIAGRKGGGLGLCLSKQLCLAMDGDLVIDDEPRQGVKFIVKLHGGLENVSNLSPSELDRMNSSKVSNMLQDQLTQKHPDVLIPKDKDMVHSISDDGAPEDPEPPSIDTSMLKLNLKFLLVDDSNAACKLLHRRLAIAYNEVFADTLITYAQHGEEALSLCTGGNCSFDVVVIDQNMQSTGGVLLGHEVVKELRLLPGTKRTAIIGCSGNSLTCADDFLGAGADMCWGKPTPSTDQMLLDIQRARIFRVGVNAGVLPGNICLLCVESKETKEMMELIAM